MSISGLSSLGYFSSGGPIRWPQTLLRWCIENIHTTDKLLCVSVKSADDATKKTKEENNGVTGANKKMCFYKKPHLILCCHTFHFFSIRETDLCANETTQVPPPHQYFHLRQKHIHPPETVNTFLIQDSEAIWDCVVFQPCSRRNAINWERVVAEPRSRWDVAG